MSNSTVDAVVSKIRQEKDLSHFQSVDMDDGRWRVFVNKCRRDLDLPIQKDDTVKIDDVAKKLSQSVGKRSPDPQNLTDEELERAIDQLMAEVSMPGGERYRDELREHREEAERRGLFVGSRDEMESVREDSLGKRSIREYQREFQDHIDGMRRAAKPLPSDKIDRKVLYRLANRLESIVSAITRGDTDEALQLMERVQDKMDTYSGVDYLIDYRTDINSLIREFRDDVKKSDDSLERSVEKVSMQIDPVDGSVADERPSDMIVDDAKASIRSLEMSSPGNIDGIDLVTASKLVLSSSAIANTDWRFVTDAMNENTAARSRIGTGKDLYEDFMDGLEESMQRNSPTPLNIVFGA